MKRRISSAGVIAGILLLVAFCTSGAPLRVHVAEAIALIFAFVLPSMWIGGWKDLRRRPALPFIAGIVGGLAWEIGAAITVTKVEVFHLPWIYPTAVVGSTMLLAIHAAVMSALSGRDLRRDGAVQPLGQPPEARSVGPPRCPGDGTSPSAASSHPH